MMMDQEGPEDLDMQLIGSFLSCASRGDRVGLNQMLRAGTSPNVQDYDNRTALHLAASEGHASIVELLIQYNANVNLEDRWQRTPLTDAKIYGHRDICRILEVNGGKDSSNYHPLTFPHEKSIDELDIDMSELSAEQLLKVDQGRFGISIRVKWRGTWVVKTTIKRITSSPVTVKLSSKDMSLLRELRHPNILQFLGATVHGEELVLITEYLSGGTLRDILNRKLRFDLQTTLRYALDIARGMNYLHQHKPEPIVHDCLDFTNLLQDEGGHLKIGEYWVQMLYEQKHSFQKDCEGTHCMGCNSLDDTKRDIYSFGSIFYEMLEGRALFPDSNFSLTQPTRTDEADHLLKFKLSRCPDRIQHLIRQCVKADNPYRPSFASIIEVLEEVSISLAKPGCPVC
ncbi:serine/threonine-protein kinase 12-like [Aristolochia californica]|uniref:serine/threonine-protein kinase 12-like n=1 Tax=Aristolochia californica TaxID=171875 RepID=UPI0035E340F6